MSHAFNLSRMSMRIFRKGVKRGMMTVLEKSFNLTVVLALLLQPVGTAGVYGAFSFSSGIVIAADEQPTAVVVGEEPKEEKEEAKQEEVKEEAVKAKPETETKKESEGESVKESGEPKKITSKDPVEEGVVELVLVPEGGDEKETVTEEVPSVGEEALPPVVNEAEVPAVEGLVVLPVVLEEETKETEASEDVVEKIWQEEGRKATTSHVVVLSQKYVAPQNDEVTVTFTKLPEHPGTLSIEEVKLSSKQVAELGAFSDTAYDVTSSMEDGTFAYVLTLPIPKNKKDVQVKYATGTADIENAETVARKNVDQKQNTVEVTLDHFTLFVATYGDVAFATEQSEYVPGDTVYVKATGLNDTKFYKIFINPPTGSSFSVPNSSCFNPGDGVTEYSALYVLPGNAEISNDWAAELKEYSVSGCTGPTTISDSFVVVAPEEQQHIDVTFCHATPPDTAANGYEQITTDDDGIIKQGHATEHSADIIPPFTVGEVSFPGQNWTALGQAIWNNDCQPVGSLKAVKVVDDDSDLTQWSFQLGDSTPVQADASGEVDFGYVPVGEYTITESGVASYNLVNVSGSNCSSISESTQAGALVLSGITTVCTFSNAVDKGSITIVKDAVPDDPQDFGFTVTNMEVTRLTLDDDGDSENEFSNSQTYSGLWPGQYSFTEDVTPGWELTGMNCVSSNVSLDMLVSPTADITLAPGESVTCTYTNTKNEEALTAVCGDGVVNQESEQCDGTDGVTEGENFCTFICALVPIYDGGGTCSEETEKVLVGSHFVSGTTNPDGISIPLVAGHEYVLEATGNYSYGGVAVNHASNRADAGYSSDDNFSGPNLLNSLFGIAPTAFYRGTHSLISDLGTGTFGVVDWGDYDASHVYPLALTPGTDMDVRFMISDWYNTWYNGDWLSEPNKNQQGYRDNEGGLTVDVYECQPIEDTGSITIVKDAQPDHAQDFDFVLDPEALEFTLDDDADPLLEDRVTWSNLVAGLYTVTEASVLGWNLEGVACVSDKRSLESSTNSTRNIDLLAGENITCTFTNVPDEMVPVCGDGIVNTEGEQCDGTDGVTEGENFCTFSCQLIPIYEGGGVCSEGTERVLVDTKFVESFMTDDVVPAPVTVTLEGGKEYVVESVGDFGYGGVETNNAVNRADAGYVTDSNWVNPNLDTLFGTPATAYYRGIHSLISDMGTGTFGVVDWGGYNSEHTYAKQFAPVATTDIQFTISDWYDTWYSGDELSDINKNQFGFRDNEGGLTLNIYECQPVEEEENPQLRLRKFNDSVGDEVPGNEVVYTLEVTVLDGPVDDVTVTDLPPEGFVYVAGSGEGAPFIHEYASPGIWDLGDMVAGETRTLSYRARISDAQDAGFYKDLAFAKGVGGESVVYANSALDPFVGTEVNVVLDDTETVVLPEDNENKRVEKTKKKTQYVLGAATVLPMTGVGLGMIETALAFLLGGLGLILVARRRARVLPVLALFLVGGVGLLPQPAGAASLSVEIETPEAVTNTPHIKIGFVTLDVLARSLTVECYKDSDVTPFASYTLASAFGGNSGDCQVDGTVMPIDTAYEFYVKAIASGEGGESVESNHVSVTLSSATPGTPYNYNRDDASCQNVITFTTADDGGKTVKVELYRSLSTTFTADASTKVAEQAIGSNASGSFVEAAPGCSNDSYYVLRAVTGNGNGSGFVGDKDVNVDTHTVIKNKTTTVTLAGGTSAGAIPVSGGSDVSEGQVEGATTTNPDNEAVTPAGTEPGSVLGETTEANANQGTGFWEMMKNHPWRSLFTLIIGGILGYFGYQFYRRKHDASVQ